MRGPPGPCRLKKAVDGGADGIVHCKACSCAADMPSAAYSGGSGVKLRNAGGWRAFARGVTCMNSGGGAFAGRSPWPPRTGPGGRSSAHGSPCCPQRCGGGPEIANGGTGGAWPGVAGDGGAWRVGSGAGHALGAGPGV